MPLGIKSMMDRVFCWTGISLKTAANVKLKHTHGALTRITLDALFQTVFLKINNHVGKHTCIVGQL